MIFPNGGAIFGFNALTGHAGAHHFRQTINVDSIDAHALFNGGAHVIGPGLSTKNTYAQRTAAGVNALALKLIGNGQHVAGRHHDDVGFEILNQLHLALGLAATKRHHGEAQFFCSVMRAQTAGKQTVAITHMHHVTGLGTARANASRHHSGPCVNVALGITHDCRLACGSARSMNARAT